MMPARTRIAVDMDDVIACASEAERIWFASRHGYEWTDATLHGRRFAELVEADHLRLFEEMLHEGAFFGGLSVMPGSQAALASLSERYEIFITTAAMEYPASCAFKYTWLREHFPFVAPSQIVFCGDKSIIHADYLVDDNVRHFQRFSGRGILFSAPHNGTTEWPARVSGWTEALAFFADRHRPDGAPQSI